ncbi:nucleotidyltransferase domain-containing protein [Caldisericum exile]|uniref:nucleotidyltransferase domain-containing protein n=1 Tax=Caldisericum exile TaxID=693075 RepID=UPI00155B210E|nr:nucleotidyltransferase domain-containing protein [Caldisericum exile]
MKDKIQRQKEYIEKAKVYIINLSKRIDIIEAFVIGSVSRGDFNDASDIDVVIIAKKLPKHPIERMKLLYENIPPLIEPKAYTEEEFQRLLKKQNPIAEETVKIGIKIYPTF